MKKGFTYTTKPTPNPSLREGSCRSGFTLVELAIVLVIIGLLVGGVLAGQSMVRAAKLHGFVEQMTGLEVAIKNFKLNTKQLPGDSNLMAIKGNNDGYVKDYYNNDDYLQGEIGLVWVHLGETKMLPKTYTRIASNGDIPQYDVHIPKVDYGEVDAGVVMLTPLNSSDPHYLEQVLWVSHFPEHTNNRTWGGNCYGCAYPFTSKQALAYDKKVDDGLPDSGSVRPASYAEVGQAGASCKSGGVYNISTGDTAYCTLVKKIFD